MWGGLRGDKNETVRLWNFQSIVGNKCVRSEVCEQKSEVRWLTKALPPDAQDRQNASGQVSNRRKKIVL